MKHNTSKTIEITANHIEVYRYEIALKLLRYFGHIISSIEFDVYVYGLMQGNEITNQVNKYCSKSLTRVLIRNLRSDQIDEWKNSFENVKSVYLLGSSNCDNIQLNILFPLMQRLEFELMEFTDSSFIEHHFPHLKHLKYFQTFSHQDNTHMERVLLLNPQLRSFSISGLADAEFLEFTAQQLPNLEVLSLLNFPHEFRSNQSDRVARFGNVRELTVSLYRNQHEVPAHIPMVFDRLEILKLYCYYIPRALVRFICENKQLKAIHVTEAVPNYEHLLRFVRDLPNLEEISARWKPDDDGHGLIMLLSKKDVKLSKITVFLYGNTDDMRSALFAAIPSELQLIDDRGSQFSFIHREKYSQEI